MVKQYTVYKIVNGVNGKFYIGVHKTTNANDEYLGSGKLIKRAIQKYGAENFQKEVIAIFDSADLAYKLEAELISKALGTKLCYNLKSGGRGGFDWINKNGLSNHSRCGRAMNQAIKERLLADPVFKKRWVEAQAYKFQKMKKRANESDVKQKATEARRKFWCGRQHSQETRRIQSEKARLRTGSKNSQFGTRWITNGTLNQKISVAQTIPEGWVLGREMR